MMDLQREINKLNSIDTTPEELIAYLDIHQNYILSNAILQLVKRSINSDDAIKKLSSLTSLVRKENQLMGIYTIGHLAAAAISKLDSSPNKRKFHEVLSTLSEWDQSCVAGLLAGNVFN